LNRLPAFAVQPGLFPLTYVLLTASGACTVFAFSFVDGPIKALANIAPDTRLEQLTTQVAAGPIDSIHLSSSQE